MNAPRHPQQSPRPDQWGQYSQDPRQTYAQQPPAPPKRRRVWPWVLGAIVLIPILLFAGCTALVGGAVNSVQQQRAGGTVAIGQTYTYPSGLGLAVSKLAPHKSSNPYIVAADEAAYQGTVTLVNGTSKPVGASLVTIAGTVGSTAVERVFDGLPLTTADVQAGQTLKIPFQFKVKKGTTGPLSISVTAALNEPVFFTGTL